MNMGEQEALFSHSCGIVDKPCDRVSVPITLQSTDTTTWLYPLQTSRVLRGVGMIVARDLG